jgi:hypothetical protein
MGLTRIIFLIIVGYFFYKGVKALIALFSQKDNNAAQSMNTNYSRTNSGKSKINQKDIIDADFEDIDDPEEKN